MRMTASTDYGFGTVFVLSVFSYYDIVGFALDFTDTFLFMKSISFEMRSIISQST